MSDILERLREPMIVYNIPMSVTSQQYYNNQRLEAADHIDKQGDEIERLEAENQQLRGHLDAADAQIEALEAKLGPDCCACSYDYAGDVCSVHSPMLRKAEAEIERLRAALRYCGKKGFI